MNKKAGVLVLVENQSQSLILTKRSKRMPIHAGEVSFPGGRWQPTDLDTEATALRETSEEIGIRQEQVCVLYSMNKVITLTDYEITPYFAKIEHITEYHLQVDEVEKLIKIPMELVKEKRSYKPTVRQFGGSTVTTLQFCHPQYFIWGATAKIMLQLVDLPIWGG